MFAGSGPSFPNAEVSAHAEMEKKIEGRELEMEEFGAAVDLSDDLCLDLLFEMADRGGGDGARPAHLGRENCPPDQLRPQNSGDGLDFRQFRHGGRSAAVPVACRSQPSSSGRLLIEHLADAAPFMGTADYLAQ